MKTVLAAIKAVLEIFNLVKEAVKLYKQAKREGWIQDGREIAKKIKDADSDDKRRELVKDLAKHTRSVP